MHYIIKSVKQNWIYFLKSENMFFFSSPSTKPDIMNLFPNALIVHIPRAGHWVHSDNPFEFMECVLGFLNAEANGLLYKHVPS